MYITIEKYTIFQLKSIPVLIVCEDKKTELSYFNQIMLSSARVRPVGEGFNTISLVNRAIQIANQGNY